MTARPILMHARSIQNLLAGRKTQTRRIVKATRGRPIEFVGGGPIGGPDWNDPNCWGYESGDAEWLLLKPGENEYQYPCPYGQPGDLLWVREAHAYVGTTDPGWLLYRANGYEAECARHGFTKPWPPESEFQWKPSIHMPRRASRLTLELTDVRVERVQECSEADALAEGVVVPPTPPAYRDATGELVLPHTRTARLEFISLWNDTNGPGAWERNDWCWALTFRVIQANVDAVLREAADESRAPACDLCGGGGCSVCNGVSVP